VTSVYEFIDGEKANYPIVSMCVWSNVSRSGYYEWAGRGWSATARRRFWLAVQVAKAFKANRGTYGYRRVHEVLVRRGIEIGPELVRRLMADMDLVACQPKPWRVTTVAGAGDAPVDRVERDFTAGCPGMVMVGDITYIHTWQGWVYLATVIDLCTKEVVGWALADHMRASLVCDALTMASQRRTLADGAVFHSDRGCQYTSQEVAEHLASLHMVGSMGRTGVCWDNALAESFFASLKKELVHRTVYSTRKKAIDSVVEYIDIFYNRQRLHSGLGYRTPYEAYTQHQTVPQAA
jgi:putative transposase